MWNKNELTELLKIQYPIIQGPFGGGFSTTKLAAAVSNAGGMGSFGAHNLGPADIIKKVAEIKSLTDKPFGMNLWVSSSDKKTQDLTESSYQEIAQNYKNYFADLKLAIPPFPKKFGESFDEQVEALIEAKPPAFSFVFGIPSPAILDRCRKNNILTMGAATTLDEALAIEKAGIDCVVLSGFEAGGHRPSFLRETEDSLMGLSALISQVAGRIKIPIIAAGGLCDAKSIGAVSLLGAQGFQLGTAFLACEESGASAVHKEVLFSPRAKTTVLSRHYSGRLARFIENQYLIDNKKKGTAFLPYPAQNYLLAAMKKASAEAGLVEVTPLYAGQGAPNLKHKKASELMQALVQEIPQFIRK